MNPFLRVVFAISVVVCSACAAHRDALSMSLAWSPSSDPGDVSSMAMSAFASQKVLLLPFTDERTVKEIGSNTQEVAARPVTAVGDVAGFVTMHVSDVLQASHVLVVQSDPTRTLKGSVVQFFVKEDNTYNGTVVLNVTLLDAQGAILWQGVATGRSKRFGRSLSAENYNETLSEGVLEAVHDLLKNPGFLDAVHGK